MLNCLSSDMTVEMLRTDCGASLIDCSRMIAEAKCAIARLDELNDALAEAGRQEAEAVAAHGSGAAADAARLDRVREDDLPKIPEPTAGRTGVTSVDWDRFKIGLEQWIGGHSPAVLTGLKFAMNQEAEMLDGWHASLNEVDSRFDRRMGARCFNSAHKLVQNVIYKEESRFIAGQPSLVKTILSMEIRR